MAPLSLDFIFILDRLDLIKQVDHGLQSIPSSRSQRQSEPHSSRIVPRSAVSAFTLVQTQNQEEPTIFVMPGYSNVVVDVGKRLQCHLCTGELLLLLHFEWMYHIQHVSQTRFFKPSG